MSLRRAASQSSLSSLGGNTSKKHTGSSPSLQKVRSNPELTSLHLADNSYEDSCKKNTSLYDYKQKRIIVKVKLGVQKQLEEFAVIVQDFSFANDMINSQDTTKSCILAALMMYTINKDDFNKEKRLKFISGVFCTLHFVNEMSAYSLIIK
jgi:hypothetical protein